MSAINLDLDIFANRNLTFELQWFKPDDTPEIITGYGAIFAVVNAAGQPIILATHTDDITITGATGTIAVDIPNTKTANLDFVVLPWELVLFPTAADPRVNPFQFAYGSAKYHKTFLDLDKIALQL